MKLIGNLLMLVCVITGSLAAASAYLTPTESLEGRTPRSPAGRIERSTEPIEDLRDQYADGQISKDVVEESVSALREQHRAGSMSAQAFLQQSESPLPILSPDDVGEDGVTAEQVSDLATAGVAYVRTKEFSWPYWWVFAVSAVGLGAGSLLVRVATKREQQTDTSASDSKTVSPDESIANLIEAAESLRDELAATTDPAERQRLLLTRLNEMQRTDVEAFVDARLALTTRLGLGRYAEIMDRFAAAERQINRAWSAAADAALDEALDCITRVPMLLLEVREKLSD